MKTLTIILTDGPYISEYAEMAYKIASESLKDFRLIYISSPGCGAYSQARAKAFSFWKCWPVIPGAGREGSCGQGLCQVCHSQRLPGRGRWRLRGLSSGEKITSLYDLAEMMEKSDRAIAIRRQVKHGQ